MAKEKKEAAPKGGNCKIKFNGKEVTIPRADLKWFVEEKGAKEIK